VLQRLPQPRLTQPADIRWLPTWRHERSRTYRSPGPPTQRHTRRHTTALGNPTQPAHGRRCPWPSLTRRRS
jgi:hypothetical protein